VYSLLLLKNFVEHFANMQSLNLARIWAEQSLIVIFPFASAKVQRAKRGKSHKDTIKYPLNIY